jgi:ABC-2 type transport system permease protein
VVGYLTDALVSFSRSDPAYARLLNRWGYGSMITVKGFVAEIGVIMALALSFLVVTLLTMVSADNLQGRLEVPFASGTGRVKWLSANLAATSLGLLVVALVSGVAMWAGVEFSGSTIALSVTLKGMLNSVSVAPLIVGVATAFAVWLPRLAFTAMAVLLSLCYVISMLGPILHWPTWLLDVSPFHFLHLVPSQGPNWGATTMFLLIGSALTTVASIGFARGDLGR